MTNVHITPHFSSDGESLLDLKFESTKVTLSEANALELIHALADALCKMKALKPPSNQN